MKSLRLSLVLVILLVVITPKIVSAQYSSNNYQTNEYQFGTGGDPQVTSPNYQAQAGIGSLGVGTVSGTAYQSYTGFLTPNEPFLELGIDTSSVNLGVLDTGSTKTGSANFHVRSYLDSGYTVLSVSQPPTVTSGAGSHTLAAKASLGAPAPGTEEFGINLVANTSPTTFGNDPSPQPDNTFATGQAAAGYGTQNQFKYNPGDVIAQSNANGWGLTNYTISYIANISLLTPAGSYSAEQDLVAVATF
ncbi:MAG TPA: hypothetical protein VFW52_03140 [Candidatus Saccharimonadales bacterium]|nr:hypothetical protein [Candidatus Saccharimonadales bacterium]